MGVYDNHTSDYLIDLVSLDEAYIGKLPGLIEIEKQIGVIRASGLSPFKDNSTSPEVLKLNRLFEKQFGMDVYALHIDPSETVNAYTQVVANTFDLAELEDMPRWVEASQANGFRFKKDNPFCILVTIYFGIINDPQYTDAEILAILLHELGHNFADCLYDVINISNKRMMNNYRAALLKSAAIAVWIPILGWIYAAQVKKLINKTLNNGARNAAEKKRQSGKQHNIAAFFTGLKTKYVDFSAYISEIINRLAGGGWIESYKRYLIQNGLGGEETKKKVGRQNEVFADKFAGVYGYGPEQGSALMKMTNNQSKASKKVDSLGEAARRANDSYIEALRDITDFDVHPHLIQRINSEIHLLEAELKKKDIDPKMKAVMQAQIDEMKRQLANLVKAQATASDREKAQAAYNKSKLKNDPNATTEQLEKDIEAAYDRLLDDQKKRSKAMRNKTKKGSSK